MSGSREDVIQTISNLSSASSRHVYNALVRVRTKVIKCRKDLQRSLQQGLVPKLLQILDDADSKESKPKVADIALSILGNICMEPEARNLVINSNGVESISRHLLESPVESIQNRSCRGLANLALSPSTCPKIIGLDIASHVATLLQATKSKECQLTYCRVFRLLGRSRPVQKRVVEAGAVLPIARLVKNDDPEVAKCALTTIADLIKTGCCSSFARQMIGASVLDKYIAMVTGDNLDASHHALSTLFCLTDQPDARAAIGAAGGVQLFINLLQNTDDHTHVSRISMINALCLCGKEAVNRMKIREMGGLELFLDALEDSAFAQVHDRIISGLVCFLYDDVSIEILLENKLVPILLVHLQRCGRFKSTVEVLMFPDNPASKGPDVPRRDSTVKEIHEKNESLHDGFEACGHAESAKVDRPQNINFKDIEAQCAGFCCDVESSPSTDSEHEAIPPAQEESELNKFSIDSPTYEVNTDWNLEQYAGQTCKQTFTQQEHVRTPSPGPPLSPLSNDTYFSPAQSSPAYSLPRSPVSDPGSSDLDNEYHPVLSVSYLSRETSPVESSRRDLFQYSSEEDDQEDCETSGNFDDAVTSVKSVGKGEAAAVGGDSRCGKSEEEDVNRRTSGKRPLALRSPSYKLEESCSKRTKHDVKRSDNMRTTEKNILILLSRVSVKTNPSSHLVTLPVISCMLDYLFYVHQPHSRCVRTLSRLFKNPHCFEICLLLNIPWVLYKKIILDADGIDKESYANFSQRRPSRSRSSSRLSSDSEDSFCGGYLTSLDGNYPGPSTGTRDNALDFTHGLLASPTSPRSEAEINFKIGPSPVSQNTAELSVAEVGQSGLGLLKDLSFSGESAFGRGIISYILLRRPKQKLACIISLLFLCWGSEMKKQYLVRFRLLDSVVDLLKEDLMDPGPVFMAIVAGLSFMCKLNNIPSKLKQEKSEPFFKPVLTTDSDGKVTCVYENLETDVAFNVDCRTIKANREKLAQSSAMFLAMLEGHYSESSQSEIRIQDTSHDALEYVLHYLQGCQLNCPILKKVELKSNLVIDFLLDVLSLADRFLLVDLAMYIKVATSSYYLDSESCAAVFEFASFHQFSDLESDCVKAILTSPIALLEKSELLAHMMISDCADVFIEKLKLVLREGIN